MINDAGMNSEMADAKLAITKMGKIEWWGLIVAFRLRIWFMTVIMCTL